MYVESKVPKDLKKYKDKMAGFTIRQILCIAISTVIDVMLWSYVFKYINVPVNYKIYITIVCDLPVMAFIAEPSGMKMEKYIKHVIVRGFTYPRFRYAKKKINTHKYEIDKKIIRQRKKEIPKLIREHPELKPYR